MDIRFLLTFTIYLFSSGCSSFPEVVGEFENESEDRVIIAYDTEKSEYSFSHGDITHFTTPTNQEKFKLLVQSSYLDLVIPHSLVPEVITEELGMKTSVDNLSEFEKKLFPLSDDLVKIQVERAKYLLSQGKKFKRPIGSKNIVLFYSPKKGLQGFRIENSLYRKVAK